jgi:branched-chain amino acid transport system ATP-binding protein
MLEVSNLSAGYRDTKVLFDVSFRIGRGEVVTLLGRNGMGKTTTVSAIMGFLRASAGQISFDGKPITGRSSHAIAKAGIGLVPEGRQVFPNLTTFENLHVAGRKASSGGATLWTIESVIALFPALQPKLPILARLLSGGEQQMLAIGRALMTNPKLVILDEATEGLAPIIRGEIWRCLAAIKAQGQSILVIDKNVKALSKIADRHYFIEKGMTALSCNSAELMADPELRHRYMGV